MVIRWERDQSSRLVATVKVASMSCISGVGAETADMGMPRVPEQMVSTRGTYVDGEDGGGETEDGRSQILG